MSHYSPYLFSSQPPNGKYSTGWELLIAAGTGALLILTWLGYGYR